MESTLRVDHRQYVLTLVPEHQLGLVDCVPPSHPGFDCVPVFPCWAVGRAGVGLAWGHREQVDEHTVYIEEGDVEGG